MTGVAAAAITVLSILALSSQAAECASRVAVGDIYGDPFGNLILTIPGSTSSPVSLSDGGRKFAPNVPFESNVTLPDDVASAKSVLLKWKVVDIRQMMIVTNVSLTSRIGSLQQQQQQQARVFCAKDSISTLYMSRDFEYDAC